MSEPNVRLRISLVIVKKDFHHFKCRQISPFGLAFAWKFHCFFLNMISRLAISRRGQVFGSNLIYIMKLAILLWYNYWCPVDTYFPWVYVSFEFSGGIRLKICSVTSAKFPAQEANLANTVVPLATTLYKIGMALL